MYIMSVWKELPRVRDHVRPSPGREPGRAVAKAECANDATVAHMSTVASRDLRNHTAEVLRQVSDGTRVTITVNGRPVAEIGPVRTLRPQYFTKSQLLELITRRQADATLSRELEVLAGDTTDDLDDL